MTLSLRWFLRLSCLLWVFVSFTHLVQAQQVCPAGYPLTTPNSDFASAGNGMVQHLPTGLIWKRCAEGQSWNGSTCTGTAATYTWLQAFERVDAVNAAAAGTENLGQTDWRVPNINELKSLVEQGCYTPAINLTQFPTTSAPYFWSASPVAGLSDYAWRMNLGLGYGHWDYRSYAYPVRLVRAGQSFLNFDAAAGTVTVSKAAIAGTAAGNVPAATPFPITLTCGAITLGPINTTTAAPAVFNNVPPGSCTVAEGALPTLTGVSWGAPSYSPANPITVTVFANTAVTVTNTANVTTYPVTASGGTGGSISPASQTVTHGATTTFTVTPNAGYTAAVNGCDGSLSGITYTTGPITGACTVTASFSQNSYTVTASGGAGGSISPASQTVNHGATTTFTVTPNAGYTAAVSGCGGSLVGATYTTGPITGVCTVTASFSQIPPTTHTIAVTGNPAAGGTVSCTPNPVTQGGTATCTAGPAAGYTFSGWSGDCTGTGACTLTNVTSTKSVTASFTQNSYPITAVANPAVGGAVSCTPNPVNHGATSTCTATPNAGYTFSGWSGDCTGTGACTLTNVTSAKSVTARFAAAAQKTYTGPTVTGTGNATATVSGGGESCGFSDARFVPLSSVATAPPTGYSFPQGLFKFTLTQCTVGSTVTLSIRYPAVLPEGISYWKYGPTTDQAERWYPLAQAVINGATVTFSLTDGGLGDNDLKADGTISDPSGPAVLAADIPTLSEWATLILLSVLLGIGGWTLRRRELR